VTDRVPSLVRTALTLARVHDSRRSVVQKGEGNRAAMRLMAATTELLQGVLQLADEPQGVDLEERLDAVPGDDLAEGDKDQHGGEDARKAGED